MAALALWSCSQVMEVFNDLPVEMLERGDVGYRSLVRAYSQSTFKNGFDARELKDLHEVCRSLDSQALHRAAERALEVLPTEPGDPLLFGSLLGAYTPGDGGDVQDYSATMAISGSEVVITVAPRGA
ncbi:hypothetical protein P3T30_007063 [Kitasatospora sp. MAP12-9]|uniref:hypothetical protein n=1 Tax=Kitasatospora sp. MAP12-9 TaxID=3035100 RepID=UPI003D2305DD